MIQAHPVALMMPKQEPLLVITMKKTGTPAGDYEVDVVDPTLSWQGQCLTISPYVKNDGSEVLFNIKSKIGYFDCDNRQGQHWVHDNSGFICSADFLPAKKYERQF